MNYKYKKGQIFGKRLDVPKKVLEMVYNSTLPITYYYEYHLDDKIPASCIIESERKIIEKFGIDKCRELDWELLSRSTYELSKQELLDKLLSIDSQTENINEALYESVKDILAPENYSSKMKKNYKDRLFEIPKDVDSFTATTMVLFNEGTLTLSRMIEYWDILKDKDLSYCLLKDSANENHITDTMVKSFMSEYREFTEILGEHIDIYTVISDVYNLSSEKEKNDYIKQITDNILERIDNNRIYYVTNEMYREIFKYSSLEDRLKQINPHHAKKIITELESLPKDYIFNTSIPISEILNSQVMSFIGSFGLKNVVDFNDECGEFFTKDDCKMLKLMFEMYVHYAGNEHDMMKNIYCNKEGKYIEGEFTKDQFYEAMRRMIVYGPSSFSYRSQAPDYRSITGEFRFRNSELFISEQAPDELQNLFYTKSITPQILREHPEFIQYLNGKDLSSCFKDIQIKVSDNDTSYTYANLYKYLSSKIDFDSLMDFIMQYSDILSIVFVRNSVYDHDYTIESTLLSNEGLPEIKRKIQKCLKKTIYQTGSVYPKYIPDEFKEAYPEMFLPKDAPQEMQDAFYSRTLSIDSIYSNPVYREYLKDVDLELLFKYMPVTVVVRNTSSDTRMRTVSPRVGRKEINFVSALKHTFGENEWLDIMYAYGKYIEKVYKTNKLTYFIYSYEYTEEELLNRIDRVILRNIEEGYMKYDENMPDHFKKNNPTLFLNPNISQEIRDKFYNRSLTINDLDDHPEIFDIFDSVNIMFGFPLEMAWINDTFTNSDSLKITNLNHLKIVTAYSKIQDAELEKVFREFIMENKDVLDENKIDYISEVLRRLSFSNSHEMYTFRGELAKQILKSDNPTRSVNNIENLFIKNNIPTVGKIYSCFEILHPDFQGFDFEDSNVSPALKKSSTIGKKIIVFSDLIKASFGSNNRSVNAYLDNIEIGSRLYEKIKSGQIKYEDLSNEEHEELRVFSKHLSTLHDNTLKVKKEGTAFVSTGNVLDDIMELSKRLSPDGTLDYNLGDRVIKMFCGFAGIDTLEEAKAYVRKKVGKADARNRRAAEADMVLQEGDFIKGLWPRRLSSETPLDACIRVLPKILQNGSNSKEFLGADAGTDNTPLDTDLSRIYTGNTISEKMNNTQAAGYGPIWFVLKNDDRFIITRTASETIDTKRDLSKLEAFYTGYMGPDHYGIRTGFASSEVDYIVMEEYDARVGLEIALNGFYIPVYDREGKILFTPKDYDEIREKMSGLSYYGLPEYKISNNLITDEILETKDRLINAMSTTKAYIDEIGKAIKEAINYAGIPMVVDGFIDDLTPGVCELYSTGSTARGTNVPNDSDFDYLLKIDREIFASPKRFEEFKNKMKEKLGFTDGYGGKICGQVQKENGDVLDVEISFCPRTDKIEFSTDVSLASKLDAIKKQYPDSYLDVLANIVFAKELFKSVKAYKSLKSDASQGGLGGIGIENWILQHGGSFVDAARDFVEKAEKAGSFEEFKKIYQVFDLGDNHYSDKKDVYPHDDFVGGDGKMSHEGFNKMLQVMKEYLHNLEMLEVDEDDISRGL